MGNPLATVVSSGINAWPLDGCTFTSFFDQTMGQIRLVQQAIEAIVVPVQG